MSPLIVGVGGFATAGKDSFVAGFVGKPDPTYKKQWDYSYMSAPLERSLRTLNPIVDYWITEDRAVPIRFAELCDDVGYDAAKKNPEVRRLLITMGTEVGRDQFDPDLWVKIAEKRMLEAVRRGENFALTGIRFRNELSMLATYNAVTVWIDRPGVTAVANHQSENTLGPEDFDHVIVNDGTIDDLHEKAREWVKTL